MPVRRTRPCPPDPALAASVLDVGWLRVLLRQAVRCSLASSLALAACEGGGGDPALGEVTASVRTRVVAQCKDQLWRLAPGFQLANPVDYVADRIDATPSGVLSEHGKACSGAMDVATCEAAVALEPQIGRHVLTTEADQVKLWQAPSVLTLFGAVDTPEEAIWLLQNSGYDVPCTSKIGYMNHEFSVRVERDDGGCPPQQVTTTVVVSANGATRETQTDSTIQTGQGCVTEGRRT